MIDRYTRMRKETLMSRRLNVSDIEDGIGDLMVAIDEELADSEEEDGDFEEE